MRVAVIYTKYTDYAIEVMDNFYTSIKEYGDEARKIQVRKNGVPYDYKTIKLNEFDLQIQICKHNPKMPSANSEIAQIREWCQSSKTKKLVIDTEHHLPHNAKCKWFSVGFNDIKGSGEYNNENSPADRWNELGVEIETWKNTGKYILILGQYENGISTVHLNIMNWYEDVIKSILKYKIPIVLRMHPNQRKLPTNCHKYCKILRGSIESPVTEDIRNACCVIGRTTNALNYAVPIGVPIITPDSISTAYPMASHEIDLDKLVRPEREQWCYNLAYTQWSTNEIKEGKCWSHIRKFI